MPNHNYRGNSFPLVLLCLLIQLVGCCLTPKQLELWGACGHLEMVPVRTDKVKNQIKVVLVVYVSLIVEVTP